MNEMNIVPYTEDMLPAVLEFENRLRGEENDYFWDIGEEYQRSVRNSFQDARFTPCISLLAEEDGKVVGRIDCSMIFSRFDGSIKAYLDWICVLKSERHHKVAQALLNVLREKCREQDVGVLIALTANNDEAQNFYKSVENASMHDTGIWIDIA